MLRLRNITAAYRTGGKLIKAVDDVNIDVRDDEILGVAGESGCSKSTLIKVMYGAIKSPLELVQGTIEARVEGADEVQRVVGAEQMRASWWRLISYVPQGSMNVLNPVMRIERQFSDSAPAALRTSEARRELVRFLSELNLPESVLRSYPHELSGGMRQRVTIALATFLSPAIVLADEPTTALDVVVQRGILELLMRLQRRMKNSVVIVSHDMGVHYQVTQRLAIMYAGKVVEVGATESIFSRPHHPYTKMLIQSLPRFGDREPREGIAGRPPSLLDLPRGCRFAPRCPHAMPICCEREPLLAGAGNEVQAACHLVSTAAVEDGVT